MTGTKLSLALGALCAWAVIASAAPAPSPHPSTRASASRLAPEYLSGCCSDPDVKNFGLHIDFSPWPEDSEMTTQYRSLGILFGKGASPYASHAIVRVDYARQIGCTHVLSGDPSFSGWEYFIFADPTQPRWAAVQNVGADVGYCDAANSSFIAAYDVNGNLLEAKFNDEVGFQFLSIERPFAEICQVLVGDCYGGSGVCLPDPAGTALNCLSFSPPVSLGRDLPESITLPPPPIVHVAPATGPLGLGALGLLMAALAAWLLGRRRAAPPRA